MTIWLSPPAVGSRRVSEQDSASYSDCNSLFCSHSQKAIDKGAGDAKGVAGTTGQRDATHSAAIPGADNSSKRHDVICDAKYDATCQQAEEE